MIPVTRKSLLLRVERERRKNKCFKILICKITLLNIEGESEKFINQNTNFGEEERKGEDKKAASGHPRHNRVSNENVQDQKTNTTFSLLYYKNLKNGFLTL